MINKQPAIFNIEQIEVGYSKIRVVHNTPVDLDITSRSIWVKEANALKSTASRFDTSYIGKDHIYIDNLSVGTSYDFSFSLVDSFVSTNNTLLNAQYTSTPNVLYVTDRNAVSTLTACTIDNIINVNDDQNQIGSPASTVQISFLGSAKTSVVEVSTDNFTTSEVIYTGAISNDVISVTLGSGTYKFRVTPYFTFSDGTIDTGDVNTYSEAVAVSNNIKTPANPDTLIVSAVKMLGNVASHNLKLEWSWELADKGQKQNTLVQYLEYDGIDTELDWTDAVSEISLGTDHTFNSVPYRKYLAVRVQVQGWNNNYSNFLTGQAFISEDAADSPVSGYVATTVGQPNASNTKVYIDSRYIQGFDTEAAKTFEFDASTGNVTIGKAGTYNGTEVAVPFQFDAANSRLNISGEVITDQIVAADFVMGWLGTEAPSFRTSNREATTGYTGTTSGLWMGYTEQDTFKFSMGDSSKYIKWDGTNLSISGSVTIGDSTGPTLGQQQKYVTYYKAGTSTPSTPTGGTFGTPNPSQAGWSLTVPTVEGETNYAYISQRLFTSDAASPQDASWTPPGVFTSGGSQGVPGTPAQALSVSSSSQIFSFDSSNTIIDDSDINFSANRQNITETTSWTTSPDVGTGSGDAFTLTVSNFDTLSSVLVTATAGAYSDQVKVVRVTDGESSLTVVLSNENHSIPTDYYGAAGVFTGSGTEVRVYEGSTELTYSSVSGSGIWSATATGSSITAGSVTDSGTFATVSPHGNMTANVGSVDLEITGKRLDGTAFIINKSQSLTKSIAGIPAVIKEVRFVYSSTQNGTYTDTINTWMKKGTYHDGVLQGSLSSAVKVVPDDGVSVYTEFEFSTNGSDWHTPQASTDIYIRSRTAKLGAELVTNGDLSDGTTGWGPLNAQATTTNVDGTLKSVTTEGANGSVRLDGDYIPVVVGKSYEVSATSTQTDTAHRIRVGITQHSSEYFASEDSTVPTTFKTIITPTDTSLFVYLRNTTAGTTYWDNISVKEVISDSGFGATVSIKGNAGIEGKYFETRFAKGTTAPTIDEDAEEPAGWVTNPNFSLEDNEYIWAITTTKHHTGALDTNWSAAGKWSGDTGASGVTREVRFVYSSTENGTYTSTVDVWMKQGVYYDDVLQGSLTDAVRVIPDDGGSVYTEFQFSTDGTGWHTPQVSTDLYIRSRTVTLGAERVKNNSFDSTTSWYSPRTSSTISLDNKHIRTTASSSATFGSSAELYSLIVGNKYKIVGSAYSNRATAQVRIRITSSTDLIGTEPIQSTGSGSVSVNEVFTAITETAYVGTINTAHSPSDYVDIYNISVKEINEGAWSPSVNIKGNTGTTGKYFETRFAKGTTAPTIDEDAQAPTGWSLSPNLSLADNEYIWAITTTKLHTGALDVNWSAAGKWSGDTGAQADSFKQQARYSTLISGAAATGWDATPSATQVYRQYRTVKQTESVGAFVEVASTLGVWHLFVAESIRGAGNYNHAKNEWVDDTDFTNANALLAIPDGQPVVGDIVILSNLASAETWNLTARYLGGTSGINGSSWEAFQLVINGSALVRGTVRADDFESIDPDSGSYVKLNVADDLILAGAKVWNPDETLDDTEKTLRPIFRVSKDGTGIFDGRIISDKSVFSSSFSQDAIDYIKNAVGATTDSGGLKSYNGTSGTLSGTPSSKSLGPITHYPPDDTSLGYPTTITVSGYANEQAVIMGDSSANTITITMTLYRTHVASGSKVSISTITKNTTADAYQAGPSYGGTTDYTHRHTWSHTLTVEENLVDNGAGNSYVYSVECSRSGSSLIQELEIALSAEEQTISAGVDLSNYPTTSDVLSLTGGTVTGELIVSDTDGNSLISVRAPDTGVARIEARGTNQGTGQLFVGQSSTHGGGIEYNGDNAPPSTGAGADYIALFRTTGSSSSWTARNSHANNDWEFRGEVKSSAFDEGGVLLSAKYQLTQAPQTPSITSTGVVDETIELIFAASSTTGVDHYEVWSDGATGSDYSLIARISEEDIAPSMSVIDTSFEIAGTIAYRVYAIKNGVYSTSATTTRTFVMPTLDVINLSIVPDLNVYHIEYNIPDTRFIDHIEIYVDKHEVLGNLARSNAVLSYSGNNKQHTYSISNINLDNFHQFWVEIVST